MDRFHRALLHIQDVAPAEVLDYFIHGLAPPVRTQMPVKNLSDFDRAAFVAERMAGAHGEPTRHPAPPGCIPMDLGAMQGTSSHSGIHSRRGGAGGHSNDKRTYHYC